MNNPESKNSWYLAGKLCFIICLLSLCIFSAAYLWISLTKTLPALLADLWLLCGLLSLAGGPGSIIWSGAVFNKGNFITAILAVLIGITVPIWFVLGLISTWQSP